MAQALASGAYPAVCNHVCSYGCSSNVEPRLEEQDEGASV